MNPCKKTSGSAITRCRGIFCAIAAASGIAACGLDSVDGDNASITVAQAAAPTDAQRAVSIEDTHAAAAPRRPPCDVDGRIDCPVPRQRARAIQEPRAAPRGPWRVERIDMADSDKPLYVLTPANPLDQPGTHYTVRSTGGVGRSHIPSGVPAVIAGHPEDERVAGQRAAQ